MEYIQLLLYTMNCSQLMWIWLEVIQTERLKSIENAHSFHSPSIHPTVRPSIYRFIHLFINLFLLIMNGMRDGQSPDNKHRLTQLLGTDVYVCIHFISIEACSVFSVHGTTIPVMPTMHKSKCIIHFSPVNLIIVIIFNFFFTSSSSSTTLTSGFFY